MLSKALVIHPNMENVMKQFKPLLEQLNKWVRLNQQFKFL